ncbi:hypothetical protein [Nocardia carnea]|uniref:hypothetical protein n=1 Tax=Nocardia carnea TaxID=37328 RepID=UPI0024560F01|nr:hypothetical protein [Nocardia carnea]
MRSSNSSARSDLSRAFVGVSFHDLLYTGQTLAAGTGATLADLKNRLYHALSVAAMRYLHAVDGRDKRWRPN